MFPTFRNHAPVLLLALLLGAGPAAAQQLGQVRIQGRDIPGLGGNQCPEPLEGDLQLSPPGLDGRHPDLELAPLFGAFL